MNFSGETKLNDIALSNLAARRALESAGLDYCCGGGKSLHQACLHADISPEEILNRLRANTKNNGDEDRNWMAMPLCDVTRHIREKHHQYVREQSFEHKYYWIRSLRSTVEIMSSSRMSVGSSQKLAET